MNTVDWQGQRTIKPDIEGRVGNEVEFESHSLQPFEHVIALALEVSLERLHLFEDFVGFQHWNGGFLEGNVRTAVEIAPTGPDRLDELLGSDDPGHSPPGKTEPLGETVDEQDIFKVSVTFGRHS